ncbi:MAG: MBL fold metallo-hydrolase [Rhodospirillales bacterium]|nr:MBL fold metallo-hydrolase [Rhodospirillales bacterium]
MIRDSNPEAGEVIEVAPGVLWLRMPLPMVGLNHINLWLVRDGDGWTMVDTGVNVPETLEIWDNVVSNHLDGLPIKRLICTHFHPDHMGVAGWFVENKAVEFWTSRCEWMLGVTLSSKREDNWTESARSFYHRAGADPEISNTIVEGPNPYSDQVFRIPASYHRISDGDEFDIGGSPWKVITGHGHSPEHVCLYNDETKVLISGDIILPKISPNQGVWPSEPDHDPLHEYLTSLDKFDSLPEDTLVLPSHGLPFTGMHTRIEELRHHHDNRLKIAHEACKNGATSWEVSSELFSPDLPGMHKMFALGETIAHLNYLMNEGKVKRVLIDNRWSYQA